MSMCNSNDRKKGKHKNLVDVTLSQDSRNNKAEKGKELGRADVACKRNLQERCSKRGYDQ